MDHLLCEIRFEEGDPRDGIGRLVATLLTEGVPARDRPELFTRGALRWDENEGIPIDVQHVRSSLAARAYPVRDAKSALSIDTPLVDGVWGREARALVKGGVATGMSIEFRSEKESRKNGLRVISQARLLRASVVDRGAYATDLEVRHEGQTTNRRMHLWL